MPLHLSIGLDEFLDSLGVGTSNLEQQRDLAAHIILGLAREQLIDENCWDFSVAGDEGYESPGISCHPSPLGCELFLWGCGSPVTNSSRFFDPSLELVFSESIKLPESVSVEDKDHREMPNAVEAHIEQRDLESAWAAVEPALNSDSNDASANYYAAVIKCLAGEQQSALRYVGVSAINASEGQVVHGLQTLDRLMIRFPNSFEVLLDLARMLQRGHDAGS